VTTLTDRYVAAVLRSVPDRARGEIERELRASIGDAIDARQAQGDGPAAAESAVLTELGDPAKLAAGYAGPQRYLIGPAVYDSYLRSLGMVLALAVPASWLLLLAVWLAGGSSLASSLATAFVGAIFVGLLVAFWTTVGYAVVDRSAEARRELAAAFEKSVGPWTPDRLPVSTSLRPVRANDAVEAIVGGTIGIVFIFVQRSVSPFSDASGQPIPFLNPGLWSTWIPIILAIMVALIVAQFAMLALGSWSPWVALAISGLSLASATVYIYLLANGELFNLEFFDKLGMRPWVEAGSIPMLILILLTVIDPVQRIAKLWGAPIGKGPGKR
jgi:hypothetical protein